MCANYETDWRRPTGWPMRNSNDWVLGTESTTSRRPGNRAPSTGDRVLILLPKDKNKLLMQWRGPYPVMARKGKVDYAVDLGHATKQAIKKYEERDLMTASGEGIQCAVVTPDGEEWKDRLPLLSLERVEDSRDVAMTDGLLERQRRQAQTLVKEFDVVFSDVPGPGGVPVTHITHQTGTHEAIPASACCAPHGQRRGAKDVGDGNNRAVPFGIQVSFPRSEEVRRHPSPMH